MGQYQQWLLAQEVDQRLKVEIESLETELLYLEDRVSILEQTVPETENVILLALLAHLQGQAREGQSGSEAQQTQNGDNEQANEAHGTLTWSNLPRLETPPVPAAASVTYFPGPPPQTRLVSDDIQAFFEERRPTDFRLAPIPTPDNAHIGEEIEVTEHLPDPETQRLNESIQRWFERWHRQMTDRARIEEVPHGQ